MQQRRNDAVIDASMFKNVVTQNKDVSLIPSRDPPNQLT
jgi:hypothetical protein